MNGHALIRPLHAGPVFTKVLVLVLALADNGGAPTVPCVFFIHTSKDLGANDQALREPSLSKRAI